MKIITISGKAQHGKDTVGALLCDTLRSKGYNVLVTHYADLLKYIAMKFFDWNGIKDEQGRSILQYVGTEIVRTKEPDYWVNFVLSILRLFPDEWDYVIIPDTRFPNEIEKLKSNYDTTSVKVFRPDFDNGLTVDQQKHASEVALDDYVFDYTLINNGDESINTEIQKLLNKIKDIQS